VFQQIKNQKEKNLVLDQIKVQVRNYRKNKDRRAGSRSLFYNLGVKSVYGMGVNKFEQLLSTHSLTLAPMRLRVVTTQSSSQSWNYTNLLNNLSVNGINQAVAGDLTYVYIGLRLFYLFGLTDLYSARIVGLYVSERMRSQDAQCTLNSWIELRGAQNVKNCIHHTDGGGQYFSNVYLAVLTKHEIKISVAHSCLENGYAEERNSLLKHHFIPTKEINSATQFSNAIRQILHFYNFERKQAGLGWRTPVEFEQHTKALAESERPVIQLYNFEHPQKRGFSEA
jgi:transposase InsO family protein